MIQSIIKSKKSYYVLGIFCIFIVWIISSAIVKNDYILPGFDLTFKALVNLITQQKTYIILGYTILRLFICITGSFCLALISAGLASLSDKIKYLFKPMIVLLKTLPIAVVIILFLVFLKANLAVYFIVGVVVFPLMYEAIVAGVESINQSIVDELRMQTKINSYVIRKVYFPLSIPYIITAFLQSFGLGLKVLVMAEYISQPKNSIGKEILFYKDLTMEMEYVFAWAIILVVLVLLIELLISTVKNKCFDW